MGREGRKFAGIDLAGSPKRPSGVSLLQGNRAEVVSLYSDEEILRTIPEDTEVIAIDAPLSLPKERCCLKDDCRCAGTIHFRVCDLELRKMKIKFFPITLGPMRLLTVRGMALKQKLEARGLRVFETYPGAAQDIWGIPRQKDQRGLKEGLRRFKLGGNWSGPEVTKHELDALTCALVAREEGRGRTISLGDPAEGLMVLPPKGRAKRGKG